MTARPTPPDLRTVRLLSFLAFGLVAAALVGFTAWAVRVTANADAVRTALTAHADLAAQVRELHERMDDVRPGAVELDGLALEVRALEAQLVAEPDLEAVRDTLERLEVALGQAARGDSAALVRARDLFDQADRHLGFARAGLDGALAEAWSQSRLQLAGVVVLAGALLGALAVVGSGATRLWRLNAEVRGLTRAEVQRARATVREVLEGLPDGVIVLQHGRVAFLNTALLQLLEVGLGDGVDEHAILGGYLGSSAGAEPREVEVRRTGGSVVLLELSPGRPVELDGEPGTLIVARDVTRRAKVEAELRMAERMSSVGTLAAGIAHEINNPLTWLLGNLEVIRGGLPDRVKDEGHRAWLSARLEKVARAAERVVGIVRKLRSWSAPQEEEAGPVDPAEVIESALELAANEVRLRARLQRSYEPHGLVQATPGALSQVLLNLLVNASQAIPEGRAQDNLIEVFVRDEGPSVAFGVRDTGGGIPPHLVDRVFEPFFTTRPVGVGTGLGLYICRTIVTRLRGTLDLDTQVGVGTRVTIRLPRLARAPALAPEARPVARPGVLPPGLRILVIDDESSVLELLVEVLAGHEVSWAGDGRRALDLCAREMFDVILCDVRMPEVSGIEVYESLLHERPGLAARLVFMTGGVGPADDHTAPRDLDRPLLEKPFTLSELYAALALAINPQVSPMVRLTDAAVTSGPGTLLPEDLE